eukprot:SAG22_NODE_1162_length_5301_cov_1.628604_4_plen_61_part_00
MFERQRSIRGNAVKTKGNGCLTPKTIATKAKSISMSVLALNNWDSTERHTTTTTTQDRLS